MKYRRLGRTELSVSAVGMGTWQFAGVWDQAFSQGDVDRIFACALDLGVNFIDTAECYGAGHVSERFIGNAIAGERDRWIIATKFGHNPENDLGDENYSAPQVQIQLEDSLRALRTDVIDVYQLHSAGNRFFNNDELWTMLDKQVQAGKIRFLGNSVPLKHLDVQVPKSHEYGISVIQTPYNAVDRRAEDIMPVFAELDLGFIARTPLASGFLGGRYQPGHDFAAGDVRNMFPQRVRDETAQAALELLSQRPQDMAPTTWAGAWCLQNLAVSVVIPGIKSVQQLRENAAAADVDLP